jgi:hypothetical protein
VTLSIKSYLPNSEPAVLSAPSAIAPKQQHPRTINDWLQCALQTHKQTLLIANTSRTQTYTLRHMLNSIKPYLQDSASVAQSAQSAMAKTQRFERHTYACLRSASAAQKHSKHKLAFYSQNLLGTPNTLQHAAQHQKSKRIAHNSDSASAAQSAQ